MQAAGVLALMFVGVRVSLGGNVFLFTNSVSMRGCQNQDGFWVWWAGSLEGAFRQLISRAD